MSSTSDVQFGLLDLSVIEDVLRVWVDYPVLPDTLWLLQAYRRGGLAHRELIQRAASIRAILTAGRRERDTWWDDAHDVPNPRHMRLILLGHSPIEPQLLDWLEERLADMNRPPPVMQEKKRRGKRGSAVSTEATAPAKP